MAGTVWHGGWGPTGVGRTSTRERAGGGDGKMRPPAGVSELETQRSKRGEPVGSGRVGRPAVNTLEKLWLEPPALPLEGPGIGDTMMAAAHPAPRSRLKLLPPR